MISTLELGNLRTTKFSLRTKQWVEIMRCPAFIPMSSPITFGAVQFKVHETFTIRSQQESLKQQNGITTAVKNEAHAPFDRSKSIAISNHTFRPIESDVFKFSFVDHSDFLFTQHDILDVPDIAVFRQHPNHWFHPMVQYMPAASSGLNRSILSTDSLQVFSRLKQTDSLRFGNAYYDKRSRDKMTPPHSPSDEKVIDTVLCHVENVVMDAVVNNPHFLDTALLDAPTGSDRDVQWKIFDVVVGNYVYRNGKTVGQM